LRITRGQVLPSAHANKKKYRKSAPDRSSFRRCGENHIHIRRKTVKLKTLYCTFVATAALLLSTAPAAWAAWPADKPIEIIVGFAAGGETDVMARTLAPFIARHLGDGAQFVVMNRPGASGAIAYSALARAKPDGYTVGVVNTPPFNFVPLQRKAGYDPSDLQLLGRVVSDPTTLIARRDSPYQTLKQVVDALKQKPGSISVGYNGVGTNGHLALLQLQQVTGVKVIDVPFAGTAQSKLALSGGHIELAFASESAVPDAEKGAGPLKVIAQFMEKRAAGLPNVPTAIEQNMRVVMPSDRGFAMPRGISEDRAARLEKAIEAAVQDPEFLKSASAYRSILAWMPAKEWQQELQRQVPALRTLANSMPKEN
jgi:tripartite-type tricarboxylate transporter receptor subunit TctC